MTNETFSTVVLNHMYEGLLSINEEGDVVPASVLSYTVSNQNSVFEFRLREDLYWSDGSKLLAQDYVNAWKRIIEFGSNNENKALLTPFVEGAKAYSEGLIDFEDVEIKAIDDRTILVKTISPTPYLVDILTHSVFFPVNIIDEQDEWYKDPDKFLSNGAFKLKSFDNDRIILEKNEYYWNSENIHLDELVFLFRDQDMNLIELYDSEQIDGVYQLSYSELNDFSNEQVEIDSNVIPSTVFLAINHEDAYLSSEEYRALFSLSLNREELVQKQLIGSGLATNYLVPITYRIDGESYRDFLDLDTAPHLDRVDILWEQLEKRGFNKERPVELIYHDNGENDETVNYLVATYKTQLGIEVKAIGMNWTDLLTTLSSRNYQLALMGWTADYNHPMTFISIFDKDSFYETITGWHDNEYDALLNKVGRLTSSEQLKVLRELEAMIIEEYHIIPLYYKKSISIMNENVKEWYKYSTYMYLHNAWIERE
jgi:oligopeptide transport system substrate-binding protein